MPIGNGGIIGPINTPSVASAKGVWSIREAMLAQSTSNWPTPVSVDPFFYSVTSLLHGDGTNGAQNNTFLDSSTNNFAITRNGNTTQGSFSPFSQTGWGNYFDGGTSTRLTFPSNTAFAFGTGAYTVEAWVYLNAHAASQSTVFEAGTANGALSVSVLSTGALSLGTYGVGALINSPASAVSLNQWNHVAVVRSSTASNDTRLYVNGTLVATGTDSSNWTVTTTPATGGLGLSGYTLNGYVSNLRVVKGTAVYTSAFTVPTTPLTAISGTSLLTCQSNRFLDNSSNAFAITVNGSPSVQPFSPFNPITPYDTSSVGGSGYFDGSGDYLSISAQTAMTLGTGDYTIEAWVYPTSVPAVYWPIIDTRAGATASPWVFGLRPIGGVLKLELYIGSQINGSITVPTNAWTHVAFSRSGTTLRGYVNGVLDVNTTNSTNMPAATTQLIGGLVDPYYGTGYMTSVRVVKGTSLYNAAFTPPTAPLTAVANTQLLCNFTNAGIFDNAADADYETVGNAQISTSVKKYGTGSMSFDGTGDYLTSPYNPWMRIVNADFTIEFWMQLGAAQADMGLVSSYENNNGWLVRLGSTFVRLFAGSSQIVVDNNFSFSTGVWYHVAVVRCANVLKMFVNGTQIGANATVTTATDTTTAGLQVGRTHTVTNDFNGYIDDLRISKGVGRYPYNFTPPTAEFPNIGGPFPTLAADPYFDYTTLLLPGNGTNGAQNNTFLDSSTNNFTITRNGNTTQGTFSPFSQTGWGNFFDGSGDYLTVASNAAFGLGTGDFTIEMWVYPTANPANGPGTMFDLRTGATATACASRIDSSLNVRFYDGPSNNEFVVGSVQLNTWVQIAFVRSSGTLRTYINGTQTNSSTVSSNLGSNLPCTIGTNQTAGYEFNGYISNFRIVKGTAVYTANFTPPTAPLTAVAGTSILTCQSNRIRDASTNNFAITVVGNTSVQAFSPFNPTAVWSAATYGGSGYFDGSGDYLNGPSTGQFAPTGDFTISMWIYPTSFAASFYVLAGSWVGAGAANEWLIQYDNTGAIRFLTTTDSTFSAAGVIKLNQWQFLSISRTGSTLTGYVNGTSFRSYTLTGTVGSATKVVYIGVQQGTTWPYIGYMADFRMVAGSAESATPPTAPATAISGTNMLLNFTNAGIYDATSKNDLETVGNAQISTTQSKFGGSSMYFDGSGDYLYRANNPNVLGSGDWTIEGWYYQTGGTGYRTLVSTRTAADGGGTATIFFGFFNNNMYFDGSTTGSLNMVGSGTITNSTWNHFAVARFGSTTTMYLNGIAQGSVSDSNAKTNPDLWIGAQNGLYPLTGYIDDLRITKGIARYTRNFTPPTAAFLTL
jgi:hypothetical protein